MKNVEKSGKTMKTTMTLTLEGYPYLVIKQAESKLKALGWVRLMRK